MANFDQKVNIKIDVDTSSLGEIATAVGEIETAQQSLNSLDSDLDDLEDGFDNFTKSIRNNREAWQGVSDDSDALADFRGSLRHTRQEARELQDAISEEIDVKTKVDKDGFISNIENNLNEALREQDLTADIAVSGDVDTPSRSSIAAQISAFVKEVEAESENITLEVDQKVKDISGLAASNIARSAEAKVQDIAPEIQPEIDLEGVEDEMAEFERFADALEVVSEKKEDVSDENERLSDRNEDTEESTLAEAESFAQLTDAGDSLAKVKENVSKANDKLTKKNEEGTRSALRETDAWDTLRDAGYSLDEAMEELNLRQRETRKESDNNRSAFRAMANAVDETGDSMRAANKVGDLFEDGLGSLSVNLGAFTVAMRNMLTQVPLLLAGLGSLGSAAVGVAGAFLTAGTAIGSAIGAGALAMAQDLDEQYKEIEGTGEALQVMMLGLRDTFVQAVSPLTENQEVIGMFRQFVVGLAEDISLVADTFDKLMTRQEDWGEGVLGISGLMDELGAKLEEPFEEFVNALSFMFMNLQDEFVDITVGLVNALSGLVRFTTRFTDGITENTRVLDEFIASLKAMAQVGATVFNGVEPVLIAFSGAMQSVAETINSMNSAFVANAITLALIVGALSRFSGVIGSVLGVLPNLVFGIKNADGSMLSMIKSFGSFAKEHSTLFAGFTSLAEAIEDMGEEMAILSLRSKMAEDSFEELGDVQAAQLRKTLMTTESMEEFKQELIEAAVSAEMTDDELEELNDELQKIGFNSVLASEGLEELGDTDADVDLDVAKGKAFGNTADAADDAADATGGLGSKLKGLKKYIPVIGSAGLSGAATQLSGSLSGVAGAISGSLGPALAIFALFGGLLVGLIGNLDAIMAGLSTTADALGSLFSWLGTAVMSLFIETWNALWDVIVGVWMVIKPFIDLLKVLGITGDSAGGAMDWLATALEFAGRFVLAMIDALGGLIRIILTVIGMILEIGVAIVAVFVAAIQALVGAIGWVINAFLEWVGLAGPINSFIGDIVTGIKGLIDWILKIPELSKAAFDVFVKVVQDAFNWVIEKINQFISTLNTIPFVNIETLDKVDFGVKGGEGARVSKEELSENTQNMFSGISGKRDKSITYNEDNSTNIDQTVNADPEDQAQLSRVVTDAIAEANSFERRRQGGQ